MRAILLLVTLAGTAAAQSSPRLLLPATPASPLTSQTATANQRLLQQIQTTNTQRSLEHQIRTADQLFRPTVTPYVTGTTLRR